MKTYTITLTDAEDKALNWVTVSAQDWMDNAVHERCRIAIEEIVIAEMQRKLSLGQELSGTKEEIVLAAPIKSAAERDQEISSNIRPE
jgi:hypothetical protein